MKPAWLVLVAALLSAAIASFPADSADAAYYNKRNAYDQYRWPWMYDQEWRITQGQNAPNLPGYSHKVGTNFR